MSSCGLWILPELWKTPNSGVSDSSLDGANSAPPTGPTGPTTTGVLPT